MVLSYMMGLFLAILYSWYVLPPVAGLPPKWQPTIRPFLVRGTVLVPVSRTHQIHMHHWVCYSVLLILLFRFLPRVIVGFFVGLIVQGLTYEDRFQFVIPRQ